MAHDLYAVLVANLAATDHQADAAAKLVSDNAPARDFVRHVTSREEWTRETVRQKLIAVRKLLPELAASAASQVVAEAASFKRADPRTVPAISKADVARKRVEAINGDA